MKWPSLLPVSKPDPHQVREQSVLCLLGGGVCLAAFIALSIECNSQAVTVDTRTGTVINTSNPVGATIDKRYEQIHPTSVALPGAELDARAKSDLYRSLQSEQGFAMRPFPRGHRGMTLHANGKLEPAGEGYLEMVTSNGMSAKPGERLVLTDIKFDHSKIVFDLNGGPDHKHRFLRHIQIGIGPSMGPAVQTDDPEPTGARLTLAFDGHVPQLTGAQVKALLAPLISFDVKTPVEAFTDTLPPQLKDAILSHRVLVGMSTDMVLFAKGQPEHKTREMDGQMPFEEWIYGKPPQEVDFVRINGNRVIRVEIAKIGEKPEIFTEDVVEGMMRTDGTPLTAPSVRTVAAGDTEHNPDTQAPVTPSLRKPGESMPGDNQRVGQMKPVQPVKPKTHPQPGENPDGEPAAAPPAGDTAQPADASSPTPAQTPPPEATKPQE